MSIADDRERPHSDELDHRSDLAAGEPAARVPVAPGKATLTARLQRRGPTADDIAVAMLQRLGLHAPAADPAAQHQLAAQGVRGGGGALPFLDRIQPAFGRHDVGGVVAHTDDAARSAAGDLGAMAYAYGNDVAFGGAPDLFTAAHEAAHVVQQRGGVHLRDGIGSAGDVWEQHADAVAQRVVDGGSAVDLLDPLTGGAMAGPVLARRIEMTRPRRGARASEASIAAFVARINQFAPGLNVTSNGTHLVAAPAPGARLTGFAAELQRYFDSATVIPMVMINSGGQIGGGHHVEVDQALNGYVDVDDMLRSDPQSFQLNLIHLLEERLRIPRYAERRGITPGHPGGIDFSQGGEFERAHNGGLRVERDHLRTLLHDPDLRGPSEQRTPRGGIVFVYTSPRHYTVHHRLEHARPHAQEGDNPTGNILAGEVTVHQHGHTFTIQQWLDGPGRPDAAAPGAAPPAGPAGEAAPAPADVQVADAGGPDANAAA